MKDIFLNLMSSNRTINFLPIFFLLIFRIIIMVFSGICIYIMLLLLIKEHMIRCKYLSAIPKISIESNWLILNRMILIVPIDQYKNQGLFIFRFWNTWCDSRIRTLTSVFTAVSNGGRLATGRFTRLVRAISDRGLTVLLVKIEDYRKLAKYAHSSRRLFNEPLRSIMQTTHPAGGNSCRWCWVECAGAVLAQLLSRLRSCRLATTKPPDPPPPTPNPRRESSPSQRRTAISVGADGGFDARHYHRAAMVKIQFSRK